MTAWMREIPDDEIVFDDDERTVILTSRQWHALDKYDFSTPTGPSPGRVYGRDGVERTKYFRKQRPDYPAEADYVYVVRQEVERPEWCEHIPYRVIAIVGEA